MKSTEEKSLKTFLLKHRAYRKFIKNFDTCSNVNIKKLKSIFDNYGIYLPFSWRNSPEGYDYWKTLARKYNHYLNT